MPNFVHTYGLGVLFSGLFRYALSPNRIIIESNLIQRPISVLEALRRHVDDGVIIDNPPTLSSFFEIDMVKVMGSLAQSTLSYRVTVSERELLVLVPPLYARACADEVSMGLQPSVNPVASTLSSVNANQQSTSRSASPEPVNSVPKMMLWVPTLFLQRTLPGLVDRYKKKKCPVVSPRRAPVCILSLPILLKAYNTPDRFLSR